MKKYNLFDVARPKQWKTISFAEMIDDGLYPVYGANGKIGRYNKYNHEKETVLITCRGATCGKINLSEPYSYINGNAMALDDVDETVVTTKYLYYYLKKYNFKKLISGSAQPQITKNVLAEVEVLVPDIQTQNKIVSVFDKVSALLKKRKDGIKILDELLRATFLDMFGDPILNSQNWSIKPLKDLAELSRGKFSPRPRNDPSFFDGNYPFIQTGDISNSKHRLKKFTQTLNEKGIRVSKQFRTGDIVIAIVGATIGATSILKIDTYATDSIIAIKPTDKTNNVFLEMLLRFYRQVLLDRAPEAARANINLSILRELKIITPPLKLQNQYLTVSNNIEDKTDRLINSLNQIGCLQESLLEKAFNGRLNFNVDIELNALIQEIDLQKKENDLSKIVGDISYLQRLIDKLNDQEFNERNLYDKAKHGVFQLMAVDEEKRRVTQVYDEKSTN